MPSGSPQGMRGWRWLEGGVGRQRESLQGTIRSKTHPPDNTLPVGELHGDLTSHEVVVDSGGPALAHQADAPQKIIQTLDHCPEPSLPPPEEHRRPHRGD